MTFIFKVPLKVPQLESSIFPIVLYLLPNHPCTCTFDYRMIGSGCHSRWAEECAYLRAIEGFLQAGPQLVLQLVIVFKGVLIHSLRDTMQMVLEDGVWNWEFFSGKCTLNTWSSLYTDRRLVFSLFNSNPSFYFRAASRLVLGPDSGVQHRPLLRVAAANVRAVQRMAEAPSHAAQAPARHPLLHVHHRVQGIRHRASRCLCRGIRRGTTGPHCTRPGR